MKNLTTFIENLIALLVGAFIPAIPTFGLGCVVTILGAVVGEIKWAIFWQCVANTVALSLAFSFFVFAVATCFVIGFISTDLLGDKSAVAVYNGPFVDGVIRSGVFLICLVAPFVTASLNGAWVHDWPIWHVAGN